jgi:hypothetical protein
VNGKTKWAIVCLKLLGIILIMGCTEGEYVLSGIRLTGVSGHTSFDLYPTLSDDEFRKITNCSAYLQIKVIPNNIQQNVSLPLTPNTNNHTLVISSQYSTLQYYHFQAPEIGHMYYVVITFFYQQYRNWRA